MPIFWQTKFLLAKIEATYGTDPTPVAASGILAKNITLSPMEGKDVLRDLETGFLGGQGSLPAELMMKLSYDVELVGSGTKGLAPEWGRLLRACGCSETLVVSTSVTYAPLSPPGLDSVTHYMWVGNTLYKLIGGRGDCDMEWPAQGIPYLHFTFSSLFAVPVELTRVTPNNNTFQKPELVSSAKTPTFTINSVPLVMRSAKLAMGNSVEGRFLVGSESVEITDRAEKFSCVVQAEALSVINPFTLAQAATYMPVSLIHGSNTGLRSTLTIPNMQMMRMSGLQQNQNIKEWPLDGTPISTLAGNDQWNLKIT